MSRLAQGKQIYDPDAYVKEQSFKKTPSSIPSLHAGEKINKPTEEEAVKVTG
jgi:hypothetical protein